MDKCLDLPLSALVPGRRRAADGTVHPARPREAVDDASGLVEAEVNGLLGDGDRNAGWEGAESYEWTR